MAVLSFTKPCAKLVLRDKKIREKNDIVDFFLLINYFSEALYKAPGRVTGLVDRELKTKDFFSGVLLTAGSQVARGPVRPHNSHTPEAATDWVY